ncbi:MAG: hypothetical protein ACLTBV_30020 [Enterocloster bolteae]
MRKGEPAKRNCEINRIVQGCVGVRRTTGQHPEALSCFRMGEEIYSFTPVQHPANDMTTSTVTTHFDYHSIDHNLLKLDILGHDDPTMIRMLAGSDQALDPVQDIPLDSQEVMSSVQEHVQASGNHAGRYRRLSPGGPGRALSSVRTLPCRCFLTPSPSISPDLGCVSAGLAHWYGCVAGTMPRP